MKREEKARKRRRAPAVLAAVILAAALAGTALAGVLDYLDLQVFSDGEDAGYSLTGGPVAKYPLSAFSPALLEASEARNGLAVVDFSFNTREEAREFVGLDIPCVWPDYGEDCTKSYQVYLFHTGSDQLWGVELYSTQYGEQGVLSQIEILIRTEHWQGEDISAGLHDSTAEGSYTQLDSYSMANGDTAEIVQYTGQTDHPHAYCEGYFMRDGILYDVKSYGTTSTLEPMVSRLHMILDAYE